MACETAGTICPTAFAFAAVLTGGNVVTLGDYEYGGDALWELDRTHATILALLQSWRLGLGRREFKGLRCWLSKQGGRLAWELVRYSLSTVHLWQLRWLMLDTVGLDTTVLDIFSRIMIETS